MHGAARVVPGRGPTDGRPAVVRASYRSREAQIERAGRGKGDVTVDGSEIVVTFPKRAHNPFLRAVDWSKLPDRVSSWLGGRRLRFD